MRACVSVFRSIRINGSNRTRSAPLSGEQGREERETEEESRETKSERANEREKEGETEEKERTEKGAWSEGAGGRERGQRRDGRGSVGDREMKAEGAWGMGGMGEAGVPVLRSFIKRRRRATRNELLVALAQSPARPTRSRVERATNIRSAYHSLGCHHSKIYYSIKLILSLLLREQMKMRDVSCYEIFLEKICKCFQN